MSFDGHGPTPFFSIVVPMFNRASQVTRCIESVLRQDWQSFEIVVVDDGSNDNSPDVVRRFVDPRIRLFLQGRNQGQCPARNRGAAEAHGEWLVFLDSDDELAPGTLRSLRSRIAESGQEVDKFLLMCRWSTGQLSPDPPLVEQRWEYPDYIGWLESVYGRPSECLSCVRRSSFLDIPYPDGHSSEAIHDLDFVRRYPVMGCGDIGRLFHRDAQNNFQIISAQRLLKLAPFYARNSEELLARHGEALARLAPRRFNDVLAAGSLNHFLVGQRRRGLRFGLLLLRRHPMRLSTLTVIGVGLLGPRPLAWLRETRDRWAAKRLARRRKPAAQVAV